MLKMATVSRQKKIEMFDRKRVIFTSCTPAQAARELSRHRLLYSLRACFTQVAKSLLMQTVVQEKVKDGHVSVH